MLQLYIFSDGLIISHFVELSIYALLGIRHRKNAGNHGGFRHFAGKPEYRELYKRRKESIERAFAGTKEKTRDAVIHNTEAWPK